VIEQIVSNALPAWLTDSPPDRLLGNHALAQSTFRDFRAFRGSHPVYEYCPGNDGSSPGQFEKNLLGGFSDESY
jgi:hypothetical protein